MKNGTTARSGTANTLQGFMKNNFQFQIYFERVDSLSMTNRSMILMKLLNQNNIKKKKCQTNSIQEEESDLNNTFK